MTSKFILFYPYMTTAFIIPCAINNFRDTDDAIEKVLHSIQSIRAISPKANIALIDYALNPLSAEQKTPLLEEVSLLAEYQQNPRIKDIEEKFDAHKAEAVSLVAALAWFFGLCQRDKLFQQTTRIVLLSAGASLDENTFKSIDSNDSGKYIFSPPENSPLESRLTGGVGMLFNTTIWSFSAEQLDSLMEALWKSLDYTFDRIKHNGYSDLGHALYKHIDSSEIFYIKNLCDQAFEAPIASSPSPTRTLHS